MIERVSTFKDRLREAMEIRGMKPIDLARIAKLSESTVSQYRSGYAEPKKEKLTRIANALDVNPVWLMSLNVQMDVNPPKGDLTTEEKELLRLFRQLSDDQKAMIIGAIKAAYEMKRGNSERVSVS